MARFIRHWIAKWETHNRQGALPFFSLKTIVTGEFGIPIVHKPTVVIRELRKLFTQYQNLNKHIRMLKKSIQSILAESGIALVRLEKEHLLSPTNDFCVLQKVAISE